LKNSFVVPRGSDRLHVEAILWNGGLPIALRGIDRPVNAKEIGDMNRDGAALAEIAAPPFSTIRSTLGAPLLRK
jgi:hypothetical protein